MMLGTSSTDVACLERCTGDKRISTDRTVTGPLEQRRGCPIVSSKGFSSYQDISLPLNHQDRAQRWRDVEIHVAHDNPPGTDRQHLRNSVVEGPRKRVLLPLT